MAVSKYVNGISNGRLDRALQNRRANNGMVQPDKRGKHAKYKHSEEEIKSVVDHISMFPRYVSHYTKSHQNSREYLASNLNLKIMYTNCTVNFVSTNLWHL